MTHRNIMPIAKAIGCSLQPDGNALLLKTAFTYAVEHGDIIHNLKLHTY